MKFKHTILLFSFIMFLSNLDAQVVEKTKTMSLGTQNALIISVPDADEKLIEKQWKDYIGEYGKVKKNRKANEYYADDIKISSISGAGTIDVYSQSVDGQLIAFFDMGNGFLSSETHQNDFENAEVFLQEFAFTVKRYMINEELDDQKDELEDLVRDLERLKRLNEGYHKDIEQAKERIAQAEINIEENIVDQENKVKEIEGQEIKVEEVRERLENVGKK